MNNYRELHVWKESVAFVTEIYQLVVQFPATEKYGLSDQIKRSAVSIPSNIAEGSGRRSHLEFLHFLSVASGSSSELSTQLEIAFRLNFLNESDFTRLQTKLEAIHKMIYRLQAAVQTNNTKPKRASTPAQSGIQPENPVQKPKTKT